MSKGILWPVDTNFRKCWIEYKVSNGHKTEHMDFPGGAVVKNLPANAGVQALVQEDPTCRGATKPMRHNY